YIVAGTSGAALSTLAIFLPSFVFVAIVYPMVPRLRGSAWMSAFLDGVNVAAIGLMLAVTWQLGRSAVVDWPSAALALVATILLLRWRINSVWLIARAGVIGTVIRWLGRWGARPPVGRYRLGETRFRLPLDAMRRRA